MPSEPGPYEFRYFANNGFTDLGLSNAVYVEVPTGFSVTSAASSISTGQLITADWTAPAERPAVDLIGLFKVGDDNREYISWTYTGGSTSGSHVFTAPSEGGNYEFRYLLNNNYTDVARSASFTVNAAGYSVTPSSTVVSPGGVIDISWTAPSGSSSADWIGLYQEAEPDNHNYLWPHWFYTGGAESGTRSLAMPSTPGRYVLRYLLNNGYTHKAESVTISVQ